MARRPFFVGLVLTVVAGALAGAGGFLTTRSARMQFVNGVVIEQSVSDARFAERTATLDDDAWSWMLAHQEANVLTPELERRVVEHVLASVAAGTATTEQLRSLSDTNVAFEKSELADAMIDGLGEPALQVTYGRQRLTLVVDANIRTLPFLHGPCTPVLAITAVRIDDVPVHATTPLGRVTAGTALLRTDFELPPTTATAARRVAVDLVWAVYDEVPESIRDGLPGPVESWPTPLALRKLTMVVEGAGDDDER